MMKKYIYLLTIAFATVVSSCKKDFISSLQNNPNVPAGASATPPLILSGALKISADIVNTSYPTYGIWMGYWCPSGNYQASASLITYSFTTTSFQTFVPWYNNLANYDVLDQMGNKDKTLANYQAIAKIMKAYGFQALVDNYNNVPYSQAFKGLAYITPVYDDASTIYDNLLVQLDAAITLINSNASAANPGSADIMFAGNMTNWKKFANSLKLRIAIRQYTNLPAKDAALKTSIAATATEGYLTSDAAGANAITGALNPGYSNSDANSGQESPFWRVFGYNQNGVPTGSSGNAYYRANNYAVNLLNSYNDIRVNYFYQPINGAVVGNDFGAANGLSNAVVSAIGGLYAGGSGSGQGLLKAPTMPAVVFSASESLFLQAEAVVDGFAVPGTASDLYQRGITASFIQLGLTSAQATAYYTQNIANVGWGASAADPIQAIITQKYFSVMGYGNLEAYNEYRRTGYPKNIPVSVYPSNTVKTIPSRIYYPSTEYQQNAANVPSSTTVTPFNSKIFWAK
jgi:hypothetical protein